MQFLEDDEIIELFVRRDEKAIVELDKKYAEVIQKKIMCKLGDEWDAEECIQDLYLIMWNTVHKQRPKYLLKYLETIGKRVMCDKLRYKNATKRKCDKIKFYDAVDTRDAYEHLRIKEINKCVKRYVLEQKEFKRRIFTLRYIYGESIKDIAQIIGKTEESVKMTLSRMRKGLKDSLYENILNS